MNVEIFFSDAGVRHDATYLSSFNISTRRIFLSEGVNNTTIGLTIDNWSYPNDDLIIHVQKLK